MQNAVIYEGWREMYAEADIVVTVAEARSRSVELRAAVEDVRGISEALHLCVRAGDFAGYKTCRETLRNLLGELVEQARFARNDLLPRLERHDYESDSDTACVRKALAAADVAIFEVNNIFKFGLESSVY